jgi:transcriptional regulator with PAS, ATPase and Fis domain
MLQLCEKAAKSNANVLLIGESGSGKEVAAHYIHHHSKRQQQALVSINCSSYTETLLESELFGHEEGAFTGAIKMKKGKIETAHGGTLFLDEIGDLSLTTQVKLLRTIEQKNIQRLGSNKELAVDFRLISATNIDIATAVSNRAFREDFFYRINTIVIPVPSLKERPEDLEDLINFMLKKSQEEHGIEINAIVDPVEKFLRAYHYPGNIRELKNVIDRMVVLSEQGVITEDGLPIMYDIQASDNKKNNYNFDQLLTLKAFKSESESHYLKWVLDLYDGNVARASEVLDMSSRQLFNKVKDYGLKD